MVLSSLGMDSIIDFAGTRRKALSALSPPLSPPMAHQIIHLPGRTTGTDYCDCGCKPGRAKMSGRLPIKVVASDITENKEHARCNIDAMHPAKIQSTTIPVFPCLVARAAPPHVLLTRRIDDGVPVGVSKLVNSRKGCFLEFLAVKFILVPWQQYCRVRASRILPPRMSRLGMYTRSQACSPP